MTNRFSGRISFNKLLFLIGVPLKSIQVKEWNKKNVINRNFNLWKKTKFWKWVEKTKKWGESKSGAT